MSNITNSFSGDLLLLVMASPELSSMCLLMSLHQQSIPLNVGQFGTISGHKILHSPANNSFTLGPKKHTMANKFMSLKTLY